MADIGGTIKYTAIGGTGIIGRTTDATSTHLLLITTAMPMPLAPTITAAGRWLALASEEVDSGAADGDTIIAIGEF